METVPEVAQLSVSAEVALMRQVRLLQRRVTGHCTNFGAPGFILAARHCPVLLVPGGLPTARPPVQPQASHAAGRARQVLVYHDLLGMMQHPHHAKVTPKFCKQYGAIGTAIQIALQQYRDEVRQGCHLGVCTSGF